MPKNDQELFSWHKMDLRQLIKSVGNEPVVPEKHVNFCGVCTIFISCPNVFKSSQVCKLEQAIVFFLPPPLGSLSVPPFIEGLGLSLCVDWLRID